jgi:hypothetical protein
MLLVTVKSLKNNNGALTAKVNAEKKLSEEYRELTLTYSAKNTDMQKAHLQEVKEWQRKEKEYKDEISKIKIAYDELHFRLKTALDNSEELEKENYKLRNRSLWGRVLNK